jgi:prephenate dehydratase
VAITVKTITIWRQQVEDSPGRLAASLVPFAAAGVDLQLVMGYHELGHGARGILEFYPVTGAKIEKAAQAASMKPARTPSLLVTGDNRAGLLHALAQALADEGLNLGFLVAQVIGRRFSAVMGFTADTDLKLAAAVLKKAATPKRPVKRTVKRAAPRAAKTARR